MTQKKDNAIGKQKLKKYLVFAVMFLAFGGCMWLIFAPSESDKEAQQQGVGFNADIPDPKDAGIIDDKKTAYEQEQVRQKQEEKMRSLQDYSFMLDSPESNQDDYQEHVSIDAVNKEPEKTPTAQSYGSVGNSSYSRRGNSFESSNAAYRDINRTLGSFYEEPKEDPEKEQLKEELEQLKAAMAQQQQVSTSVDDQLALLEKSYELAARYMPGGQEGAASTGKTNTENSSSGKKTEVVPVTQVKQQVVSSLRQPMSDLEFVKQYSQPRNRDFHTVDAEDLSSEKNTISAVVHGDQTLVNGQSVKLRMTEEMRAGRHVIPKNTILTGVGKISGERLGIEISSIEYEGNIIPVSLQAYDSDGQHGIYIPGSMEMNAVKEIAGNMGQNMGSSITITQQGQSAGQQLLTDLGRGAIQGTSQYIAKKAREVKVTLKAGYRIFLLPSANN